MAPEEIVAVMQDRMHQLQQEHREMIDTLGVRDDLVRTLRIRNLIQLETLQRQSAQIAQIYQLATNQHLIRAEQIITILEGGVP